MGKFGGSERSIAAVGKKERGALLDQEKESARTVTGDRWVSSVLSQPGPEREPNGLRTQVAAGSWGCRGKTPKAVGQAGPKRRS